MEDGVTGFVVDNLEQAMRAVRRVQYLDREACRRVFEERFSAPRMARDYVKLYRRLTGRRPAMPASRLRPVLARLPSARAPK